MTDAADGTSITGCSVVNNRSKSGAITDVNGRYSIQAQKGDVLLFRFIGYKEEKRVVKSAKLDVKMKTDDVALEECVVCLLYTSRMSSPVLPEPDGLPLCRKIRRDSSLL